MNFDFSDDQKALKSEARRFLEANASAERVRKVLDDPAKAYDEALWKAVASRAGWARRSRRSTAAWALATLSFV
jgi:hypothetical protein